MEQVLEMCDCKVGWIVDADAASTHNSVPKTCSEYIVALEQYVASQSPNTLEALRAHFGIGVTSG